MYTVFGSGTCRLLCALDLGNNIQKINPIHTFYGRDFRGINFMGKQKNTRNHIQFLKYIKNQIELPYDIKNDFFSVYHKEYEIHRRPENPDLNLKNIQDNFDNCDFYLFEISAIKIQQRGNYYISDENTNDFKQTVLTKEELKTDLEEIIRLVGEDKKIIFLNHLRLNQFGGGPLIQNRETVYSGIYEICQKYDNVYQYDPTQMIETKEHYKKYFNDPWHYSGEGMQLNFENIYNLMNKIMNKVSIEQQFITTINNDNETLYDSTDENDDYHRTNLHK